MLSDLARDCARAAWRRWLRAPAVSLIILLGFAVAAGAMQVSAETVRQQRAAVARAVPRDLQGAIGYVRVTGLQISGPETGGVGGGAVGEAQQPTPPEFTRDLFEQVAGLPGVVGVFGALDGKGVVAGGQRLRVRMVIVDGVYPFCAPADRRALEAATGAGACAINDKLAAACGGAPAAVQAFPDRIVPVAAVIQSTVWRDPGPAMYYPLSALPDQGGLAELGLVTAEPGRLRGAMDEAARLLDAAYPAARATVVPETEADRLRERLFEIRMVAAAFAAVSLAVLAVALANLSNLFALILLRQARGLAIRRAVGAPAGAIWAITLVDAAGLAACGSIAGCGVAAFIGGRWLALPPVPAAASVLLTVAVVCGAAAAAMVPLVRRLVAREPGLLLRERL
jgi:hypothetical protein